ncbi:MAG TPA: outer membrane beta-barrel protein, partial [Rhodopila sp.]|nr:outer membrane beta-barrel protein [Rhodopila sp.]
MLRARLMRSDIEVISQSVTSEGDGRMRRYQVCLAAIAGTMLLGRGAAAQGAWYISGGAGMVLPMDYSRGVTFANGLGQPGPGSNTTTYTPGETVNAAVGYHLPLGFRTEVELGYQHYLTDSISPLSTTGVLPAANGTRLVNPSDAAHDVFTSTLNLFYDLPFTFAGLTPYIGGGAGYYHASSGRAVFIDRLGGKFTTQGGNADNAIVLGEVGASYPLTPSLALVTSYRYEYFFHSSNSTVAISGNVLKI